jgi:hypothetical protein
MRGLPTVSRTMPKLELEEMALPGLSKLTKFRMLKNSARSCRFSAS